MKRARFRVGAGRAGSDLTECLLLSAPPDVPPGDGGPPPGLQAYISSGAKPLTACKCIANAV